MAGIFQEDHGGRNGGFGFVHDDAVDGAELRFVLGILGRRQGREKQQRQADAEESLAHFHFLPPATGSIRKTRWSSLMPLRASIG